MTEPSGGPAAQAAGTTASTSGVRAGLLVLAASMLGHAGNFLFYVVAARQLEPAQFAEVAAITALGLIVLTPINGVAAAAARDVAQAEAEGDRARSVASIGWLIRRMLVVQTAVFAVAVALTPVASLQLGIDDPVSWLLAALWLSLGIAVPALLGPLQGLGRFATVGVLLAGPLGMLRVLFFLPLGIWLGVPGAVLALLLATLVGVVIALRRVSNLGTKQVIFHRPDPDAGKLRGLSIAVLALLCFASLTNVDVVIAKALLDGPQAATYASAALIGKIALYGPVALSLVLLPNAAARIRLGTSIVRPVLFTRVATLACGLLTSLVFWATSRSVIVALFGAKYGDAYPLLVPLSLVMTGAALLNVDVTLAIARNDRRLVAGLVVLTVTHVALLVLLGDSPGGLIVATGITVGLGLAAHEIASRDGVVRQLWSLTEQRRRGGSGRG